MIRGIQIAYVLLAVLGGMWLWAGFGQKLINPAPNPYKDVSVVEISRDSEVLTVIANFIKTDCTIQRFEVVGSSLGVTRFLSYKDLDNLTVEHNRTLGSQTLRVAIETNGRKYDWIELRTRHDCEGREVDKVFLRIDNVQDID